MALGVGDLIVRAAELGALAIAPTSFAPEPMAGSDVPKIITAVVALATPMALAFLFRVYLRRPDNSRVATAVMCAWPATTIVLLIAASTYSGASAPLLRGYYCAAPFVWGSLTLSVAAIAGSSVNLRSKKWTWALALIPLIVGLSFFFRSRDLIASPSQMWTQTLTRCPSNEAAIDHAPDPRVGDSTSAATSLDACLMDAPNSCVCLTRRAALHLRMHEVESAKTGAIRAASLGCSKDDGTVPLREVLAEALAESGDLRGAQAEIDANPGPVKRARLIYVEALIRDLAGDSVGAESILHQAVDAGAGRDGKLLLGAVLIERHAPEDARRVLGEILEADPNDADALYDVALLDDSQNLYNDAREHYLRALRLDPHLRNARYNLAMLTLRQGILDEARHHATKFVESYPDDLRGPSLLRATGAK